MKITPFRKSSLPLIRFGKLFACACLVGFNFTNKAAADGPWTADVGFSSVQGANQWYYQQRPQGGGTTTNLVWISTGGYSSIHGSTGYYSTSDSSGWLYQLDTHPGSTSDTIRKWVAPSAGTVSISSRVYKIDTGGGGGIKASVEKNGTTIWGPKTVAYNDATGYTTDADLGGVTVASGDTIAFVVDENGTFGFDQTGWDPTITKLASYKASAQFSSVQGQNQWYYQQRPQGGGTTTNLVWLSTGGYSSVNGSTGYYQTSDASGWLYQIDTHPGSTSDTIRKWVAPSAGTISISSRVYKIDTGGGGGVKASVEKNGTTIWGPKTVAYNDTTGYTTDASLGAVSVASGDSIAFVVDENGTFGFDQTGWDPLISYGSTGPSWMLNTTDTLLTLSIVGNQPALTKLEDAATLWNWVPSSLALPIISNAYISTTHYVPNWTYTTAAVDTTSGTKVTLTFTSTTPSLALTQVWWARSGGGPVEQTTSITNNSGSTVTYNDTDVVATDLTVTADNTVTLWRFNRGSVNNGSDPNFDTGVFKTAMAATTSVPSTTSNDYNAGSYVLPFLMLDVGAAHGLYIGYECDFGLFTTSTSGNALMVRDVFQLWNANSFSQATGTTLALPGIFYGTYKGDTDTGSNKMKAWFWNNKITPTLKANTNEPLMEADITANTEAEANATLASFPIASWGVELAKEDAWWTDDVNTDSPFGWDWNPNAASWPNGMDLGTIVHAKGLKLALYMANTYKHTDLSTSAGVSSEETAVETRYNGTATNFVGLGFDYWRTDMGWEPTADYLAHLGFLQVMDYMISNHAGFRWENCSGGGSKKSFDLLQRQTFMTTEDSGSANPKSSTSYRIDVYANSYMINPLQLKCDNYDSISSPTTTQYGKYLFRTGFLGPWMWGALGFENAQALIHIPLWKTYQRPILRGADVYHILPIADRTNWDGLEYFNTALNKGSVILLKPNSSVGASPTIFLKGLVATNTYSLHFQDRSSLNSSYTSVTGSALMSGGAGIAALSGTVNDYDSEIIWINY